MVLIHYARVVCSTRFARSYDNIYDDPLLLDYVTRDHHSLSSLSSRKNRYQFPGFWCTLSRPSPETRANPWYVPFMTLASVARSVAG